MRMSFNSYSVDKLDMILHPLDISSDVLNRIPGNQEILLGKNLLIIFVMLEKKVTLSNRVIITENRIM
jgi:hypothetical protein